MFWPRFCDDFQVECATRGTTCTSTDSRENDLVDFVEVEKEGRFGDKEEVFFQHEQVTLNCFQIGLDTRVPFSPVHVTESSWRESVKK